MFYVSTFNFLNSQLIVNIIWDVISNSKQESSIKKFKIKKEV